jgi:uncharacterized protein YbjQ (UPF0145 family)
VLGTSIYHIGYQRRRWVRSHELEVLSKALYLSGQDFWTLLRTGSRPVGLVMGSCVYAVTFRAPAAATAGTMFRNVELPAYTQAMYDARELAMGRMQSEAEALGAHGVVGVELAEHAHGWGGRIIEFFSVGTAIVRGTPAEALPSPSPVIDLSR